jgi:maltose O-acetyltransferase
MSDELKKMLSGEMFDPRDPALIKMRSRARRLTRQFNAETSLSKRTGLLKQLFAKVGSKVYIEPPFFCDYGSNIFAGDDLFINVGCVILDAAEVNFGKSVLCGPNVQIYTVTHPLDPDLRATNIESAKPVKIGNRVWIGGGAIILPGISIGDNTVIGAGSVVTKDIPANVMAAGNPCRVIRKLPS